MAENNFTVNSGTYENGARTLTVGGDFTRSAGSSFNAGNAPTSTVIFNGAGTSHIHGTEFFNFTCTTAGKVLEFDGGATETINGTLTLGNPAGNVTIQGAAGGEWTIDVVSGDFSNVSFVNVRDSINAYGVTNNTYANPANSLDSGNNTFWFGSNDPDNPNPPFVLTNMDWEEDYKEGKKKRKDIKGRYKTAVIVYEGIVMVTPYDENGLHPENAALLTKGQSVTQTGEVTKAVYDEVSTGKKSVSAK